MLSDIRVSQKHMSQLKLPPTSAAECALLFKALDEAATMADALELQVASVSALFGLVQAYSMDLRAEARAHLQSLPRQLQQFQQLLRSHNDARPHYAKQFGRELMNAAAALHQRIIDFQNKAGFLFILIRVLAERNRVFCFDFIFSPC